MCGIVGCYLGQVDATSRKRVVNQMARALSYRGPDSFGDWVSDSKAIALAHRRLSILDLSPEGHQPMFSASGRYVISFNGEVYNFQLLRAELEALDATFRGTSDTEVMLAAFEVWGVEASLKRFNGMFAFAVWDNEEQQLILARDRIGIKPLYYGWQGRNFLFASELKAIKASKNYDCKVSRKNLALFMQYGYVPSPFSIYEQIYKLPPGTYLKLSEAELEGQGTEPYHYPSDEDCLNRPVYYWKLSSKINRSASVTTQHKRKIFVDQAEELLKDAVSKRMIADVPLGAFLSGGIDSSLVVALMQAQSSNRVKTFSIGFEECAYNEAQHAKAVAEHLKTDHTELYLSAKEAMNVIPKLPAIYDEPFADNSQIPTYLVSKLAREHVTVSLSGDGGDELFCGYSRYIWGANIWSSVGWLPPFLRKALAGFMRFPQTKQWNMLFKFLRPVLPESLSFHDSGEKIYRLADVLNSLSRHELYYKLISYWEPGIVKKLSGSLPVIPLTDGVDHLHQLKFMELMSYLDAISYLPDDILVKVDRASMAVSLEARVPLLDHRIAEFAWALPLDMKFYGGRSKWLLREILYRYVPSSLIDRPKMGFGVPIGIWLRGPLRDWAEDLLNEQRLAEEGFFQVQQIRALWEKHLEGGSNYQYLLWCVLMFQSWLGEQYSP